MIDLGEDVIVHANWAEHRLIMIDFEENVQVHVHYVKNVVWSWQTLKETSSSSWTTQNIRLVMIDLGENVIVYVDWADYRLIMIDLGLNV